MYSAVQWVNAESCINKGSVACRDRPRKVRNHVIDSMYCARGRGWHENRNEIEEPREICDARTYCYSLLMLKARLLPAPDGRRNLPRT